MQLGFGLGFGFGGSVWTPGILFADGSQGLWLDPTDLSTLYQDSAGTTAGALTQPVGLLLDKSQAAEAPLTFADVALIPGAGTAVNNGDGTYTATNGGVVRVRFNAASLVNGSYYLTTFNILSLAGGNCVVDWCDTTPSGTFTGTGAGQLVGTRATYDATFRFIDFLAPAAGSVTVRASDVTTRRLPGNHVLQSTTASRPTLQQATYLGLRADGVDDSLASTTGGGGAAGFLLCAAITVNGGAGTARTLWSDAGTNTGYRVRVNATNQLELAAGNGTAFTTIATTATLPVGETHAVMAWDDGVNLNVQIDNGAVASVARPVVSAGTAGMTLFKGNGAASSFLGTDLAQAVYVQATAKTANDRAMLKSFVGAKVGLSL